VWRERIESLGSKGEQCHRNFPWSLSFNTIRKNGPLRSCCNPSWSYFFGNFFSINSNFTYKYIKYISTLTKGPDTTGPICHLNLSLKRHSDMVNQFLKHLRSSQTSFVKFYTYSIVISVSTAEMSSPFLVLFMHKT
jgi:hypothetical protein